MSSGKIAEDKPRNLADILKKPKTDEERILNQWVKEQRKDFGDRGLLVKAARAEMFWSSVSVGCAISSLATSATGVGAFVFGGAGVLAAGIGYSRAKLLTKKGMAKDEVLEKNGINVKTGEGIPKDLIEAANVNMEGLSPEKFGKQITDEDKTRLLKEYKHHHRSSKAGKVFLGVEVAAAGVSAACGAIGAAVVAKNVVAATKSVAYGAKITAGTAAATLAGKEYFEEKHEKQELQNRQDKQGDGKESIDKKVDLESVKKAIRKDAKAEYLEILSRGHRRQAPTSRPSDDKKVDEVNETGVVDKKIDDSREFLSHSGDSLKDDPPPAYSLEDSGSPSINESEGSELDAPPPYSLEDPESNTPPSYGMEGSEPIPPPPYGVEFPEPSSPPVYDDKESPISASLTGIASKKESAAGETKVKGILRKVGSDATENKSVSFSDEVEFSDGVAPAELKTGGASR